MPYQSHIQTPPNYLGAVTPPVDYAAVAGRARQSARLDRESEENIALKHAALADNREFQKKNMERVGAEIKNLNLRNSLLSSSKAVENAELEYQQKIAGIEQEKRFKENDGTVQQLTSNMVHHINTGDYRGAFPYYQSLSEMITNRGADIRPETLERLNQGRQELMKQNTTIMHNGQVEIVDAYSKMMIEGLEQDVKSKGSELTVEELNRQVDNIIARSPVKVAMVLETKKAEYLKQAVYGKSYGTIYDAVNIKDAPEGSDTEEAKQLGTSYIKLKNERDDIRYKLEEYADSAESMLIVRMTLNHSTLSNTVLG